MAFPDPSFDTAFNHQVSSKKGRNPEEEDPLYALVQWLDTISARMKRMLEFPTSNWKRNIYTSRFVEQYMDEKPQMNKKTDKA